MIKEPKKKHRKEKGGIARSVKKSVNMSSSEPWSAGSKKHEQDNKPRPLKTRSTNAATPPSRKANREKLKTLMI